jgi:hypothetical protein
MKKNLHLKKDRLILAGEGPELQNGCHWWRITAAIFEHKRCKRWINKRKTAAGCMPFTAAYKQQKSARNVNHLDINNRRKKTVQVIFRFL